ncbi:hypothetical protein Clacol_007360 [Clathrus columnatus]|uniref:Uncharacterized protein n=1 Tax=Clathrus columnatus TaxID=1419009 RepID=A0AAV5AFN5_9AGAM|nr:hypothetical protein Clacol_007360 [Clathrus columnatus]
MSPSVEVSYNLHPPAPAQPPEGLRENVVHNFPIEVAEGGSSKSYYEGLQRALIEAKDVLGKELTAWRNAVGSLEKDKELQANNEGDEEDESINDGNISKWYVKCAIDKSKIKLYRLFQNIKS